LTIEKVSPTSVRLKRTGVEVLATVNDTEVVVAVDLSFMLRLFHGKIEKALNEKIPPLLRG
jgi:hypothetical protein